MDSRESGKISMQKLTLISLLLLCLTSTAVQAQFLRVYYPDIEQGSATLVVSPTGKALLVDAGSGIFLTDDSIEGFINDLIDAGIVTELVATLASHYDEDHIGRMENVFQLVPLSPTAIAYDRGDAGGVPTTFAYSDYSFGAGMHNRTTAAVCDVIDLDGGVTATVMTVNGEICGAAPIDISGSSQFENSASMTVVVNYGDFDLWIGGDLTGNVDFGLPDVESAVAPQVGDLEVYTVNHHGSRTSSVAPFLAQLAPEVVINQNAADNSHGHPNTLVVEAILATSSTLPGPPVFFQQNPGDFSDDRSDDSLASGIADCDEFGAALFTDGFESGDLGGWLGLPLAGSCPRPGSLALLSDGASYRLHACGIAATEFLIPGKTLIGDYPPAIRFTTRSPEVPLSSESVAVRARIEGAVAAEVRWWLDGVLQAPIPMTSGLAAIWDATIPAQADGTQVRFRVAANDLLAQPAISPAQGYYSGTTPIATLRSNNGDGVLLPKAYGARIAGQITAEPGLFHPTVTQSYVQDAGGGMQIFTNELLSMTRGDQVLLVGELEQFGGQTEIILARDCADYGATVLSPGTPPAPQVITIADFGEAVEGLLVRLNGVTVVDGAIPQNDSGEVTLTDDGGVSLLTLRIDGDTNIPGANTPVQAFDLIGIASQFDSWVPLTSGYQILPRERADFLSEEVNHPQVLISEILADPADDLAGDANGDGLRDASADEFIEVVNTGESAIDISGWMLRDASAVRHVFPPGSIVPSREAAVVFGGGTPTGAFGNAAANGLVFVASSGALDLDDLGDSVHLDGALSVLVQTLTYGAEANQDQSLVRDPDLSNAPPVLHTLAMGSGGILYSPGARLSGQAYTLAPGTILLSEVFYDVSGADGGYEWVELYNTSALSVDLSDLCLGNGGGDYTSSLVQLSGSISPGQSFVVGGPLSDASNGNPVYDLVVDFTPDFQNSSSSAGDGVALFDHPGCQVTAATVPVDAVVYGPNNVNGLIDESGTANPPEVGDAPSGSSIERTDLAGSWQIQAAPTPGTGPL